MTDGGGRRLIRVTDDGAGMTRDDLALAVERHATSKLPDDDLIDIRTLGFRGEALPSIGAVARLTITTRHAGEPHAWAITVDGGEKSAVKPAALGEGTRVEVRDLFYATPARLKFLKSDRSEAEAIREVVRRLAMSRPDVAFTLAGEERAPVTWAAALPGSAGRLARLADILGGDFRANAVEVRGGREGLAIEGFAALPTLTRANSLGQYLFVNGRPVRDKLLIGVVRAAYADYLPRDRHPIVALFVTVDPREVDVNVHPAKAEVRFRDPGLVRSLLIRALQEALSREGRRAATTGGNATIAACGQPRAGRAAAARLGLAALAGAPPDARGSPCPCAAPPRRLRRSRAGGLRRRRALGRRAGRGGRAGARSHRPAARRRPRAGARDLYRGADPRRAGDRRPARRARAHRLRASEGGDRKAGVARQILLIPEIVELDEADVERLTARAEELARYGLVSSRSGRARWRCARPRRCSARSTPRPSCTTSPITWRNGTRRCRSSGA